MAERKFGGPRFWAMGAIFWLLVAACLGIAHRIWPGLTETPPVVAGTVAVVVIVGFGLVFLLRPK
jgi:hypothetical protein